MSHSRSQEPGVDSAWEEGDPVVEPPGMAGTEPEVGANDAGMSTVEYAVGTVAAAAFAAVLYRIVTGDSVVSGLTKLINDAFSSL